MKKEKLRNFALAKGWVVALLLGVLYLGSKYQISIKKLASEESKTTTSSPSAGQQQAEAKKSKAESPQAEPLAVM